MAKNTETQQMIADSRSVLMLINYDSTSSLCNTVRGDPGFCLDHLSPSMSTFPTMYSDDITLDIISLALSSSLSLCRLVLCKVSLFTRIYKQPSDSIPVEERNPRYDRRRQHTVTPSLSLSKRIDVVEHRNERTHISFLSLSFD